MQSAARKTKPSALRIPRSASNSSAWFFLLPAVIIIALFLLYPIAWSFLAGFRNISIGNLSGIRPWSVPGEYVGLANYRALAADPIVAKSLWNTGFFALIFIPGTLAASLALALLVQKGIRCAGVFRAIFFLPYVVSIVAAGLVWRWMFDTEHGLINALIAASGISPPDWFGSTILAMPVIALMSIWRWSGYFMLIFLAGLQAIPEDLYEAAAVDGAGPFAVFRRITLPLLRRPMIFALFVLLIRAQNVFQEVYVMTSGGPANSTVTVTFQIWRTAFQSAMIGRGAALSYMLFLIVLLVAAAQFLMLARGRGK